MDGLPKAQKLENRLIARINHSSNFRFDLKSNVGLAKLLCICVVCVRARAHVCVASTYTHTRIYIHKLPLTIRHSTFSNSVYFIYISLSLSLFSSLFLLSIASLLIRSVSCSFSLLTHPHTYTLGEELSYYL